MLLTAISAAFGGIRPCAAQYLPNVSGTTRSPVDIPQTNLSPIAPPPTFAPPNYTSPPTASLGAPLFDPYSTGANPGTFAPALQGAQPLSSPQFPGWLSNPNGSQGTGFFNGAPASGTPTFGVGNPGFNAPNYGAPAFGQPSDGPPSYGNQGLGYQPQTFPPEAYPAGSPNTLFPGGLFSGGSFGGVSAGGYNAYRLFQGPRIRQGWVYDGNGGDSLQMNDTDASLAFAFPNFLYSGQPVYVLPSFGLHLLDGPDGSTGADLPPQLYDAFLDTGWQSDPTQLVGADLGLRVGVFSDFETANSDSLRIMGKGLVTFRLTPYSTVRGGVYYLDRNHIKLLPAFGLLYQPTQYSRYDIFFPQPKLSQYFTTLGSQDIWAYVGGEYGGGAWTIKRTSGESDNIDINDLRLLVGVEWGRSDLIRAGRHTGFFEAGFVFDREVTYKNNGNNDFSPGNTIMLRLGFGY